MTATITQRSLPLGGKRYPLVLPSLRDARLHLASVVISIHVLGQLGLGFRVSVPQILSAILSAAVVELVWTFVRNRQIVWPASAMLTGSGVALILRVVGTEPGDHWTWRGWHIFAGVAVVSLLSKYLIRFRRTHLFNPSNFGLVAAFLLLGSTRIEPLDFWWSPLNGWMLAAYLIILLGGVAITNRLRLLEMAAAFWVVFAAGLGLLSASGHCMTAAWSFAPVCDASFWWIVVTSPEVAIFLFFMITDPRTVPVGRVPRIGFSIVISLLAVLLMAPQTTEFGAKVGLLSALVIWSPLRAGFDRLLGGGWGARLTTGTGGRLLARGAAIGSALAVVALGIVTVGTPARTAAAELRPAAPPVTVDPSSLPPVTVDPEVRTLNLDLVRGDPSNLGMLLATSLAVEAEAMRTGDPALLLGVDQGVRLAELEDRIDAASADGIRVVETYHFTSIHVRLMRVDGVQASPGLLFETSGSVRREAFSPGAIASDVETSPVEITFTMRQGAGGWVISEASDL